MPSQGGHSPRISQLDKTLYLHIGFGKTGTSSLQSFFARNMERLASLGIYYPWTGRDSLDAHHYMATAVRPGGGTGYDTDVSWEDYISRLRDELAGRSEPNVLISSEVFSGMVTWRLLNLFKNLFREIRVVAYLRRQDVLIASNYNQWVKGENLTKSLSELRLLPFHFDVWTGKWETFLGDHPGGLIIRPFERGQVLNNNVIDDFMSAVFDVDVDGSFAPAHESSANQRLSLDALEFKRVVNCLCPSEIASRFIAPLTRYSQRVFDVAPEDEGAIFTPRQRRKILSEFAAGNAFVATRYMNRPDGVLFRAPPPDHKIGWIRPTLTFARALEIARFILIDQANPDEDDGLSEIEPSDVSQALDKITMACPRGLFASRKKRIEALVRGVATALHGNFSERTEEDLIGQRWAKP